MLSYEEAIRLWGVGKLNAEPKLQEEFDPERVTVYFGVDQGYPCCGGQSEGCYCTFAESPSLSATVFCIGEMGKRLTLDVEQLDFEETLREIFELASSTS